MLFQKAQPFLEMKIYQDGVLTGIDLCKESREICSHKWLFLGRSPRPYSGRSPRPYSGRFQIHIAYFFFLVQLNFIVPILAFFFIEEFCIWNESFNSCRIKVISYSYVMTELNQNTFFLLVTRCD